ncbi:dynamin family protein [Helicobacter pylori]
MFSKAENHQNEKPLKECYDLIARILNAKMENKGLEEYQCILDNNFLEFASGVDSLKEKEIALLELQEIKKELQLVASYPSLFQKNMVAVGGGFSAGKSSFLNHLLGLNLKLPENLTPTTAIPTYCLKGEREVLMGRSQNGGMVELPYLTFDHKFLDSLGFDLKSIMTFMILSSPTMLFKHLCFIDTPGYDAPNQGYTGRDRQASKEYLANAKYILWVMDCDRGPIQGNDLNYLQELYEEHGKQVFIVLNKADLKITIQLEEIAVQIKETLEDHGIEFLGIGAYSATRYQEIKEFSEKSPVFDSIEKFLTKLNKRSEKQNETLSVLYNVHLAYEKAIEQDANQFKRYQKALHSIKLDLMQKGFDDFSDASFNKIESLKKEFSEQERSKRENLAQLNQVINLFKKSIDKVFDRVSAFTWEKYKEENDDEENDEENYQEFEEIKEETNRREREFEEIKKIVSECRDYNKLYIENSGLSFEELQGHRDEVNYFNELLQSEFSMKNLLTLRQFKDTYREWYSKLRQLNEAKEVVSELRDYWLQELPPSAKDLISYCSTLLKLDYSLENLQKLRRFKDNFKKDYQKCKRSR